MSIRWRTRSLLARLTVAGAVLAAANGGLEARQSPDPAALQQRAAEGERALAEGRYGDAEKAYETLRQLSPGTAEVHARLGLIYFQQGKFTQAMVPLREARRLKPGLPKIGALLAMCLSELGQYSEALPALTKAFADNADPVLQRMAGLHLQRTYTGLGQDLDAVDVALRLSRLYPEDPEVLYHSGRLLANLAYVQTMKLAAVAPDSVWLHQAAGEANETQGLYEAALREYRMVLAAAPRRPGIRFRIGRVLIERSKGDSGGSDAAEARKAFEEELTLDPTNANAAYELGEMHRQAGELEAARQRFEQAVSHYPGFEQARLGLGRTLIALGRPADAIAHLTMAAKSHPDNEVTYYQLALAYRALGNTTEQERALAEFNRLRARTAARTAAVPQIKRDVTPQALELKPVK